MGEKNNYLKKERKIAGRHDNQTKEKESVYQAEVEKGEVEVVRPSDPQCRRSHGTLADPWIGDIYKGAKPKTNIWTPPRVVYWVKID